MKIKELENSEKETMIVAADIHLLKKPGMWSGRSEIAGDDIFALQQIAELTRKYDADLYLLGDVLDAVTTLPRPVIVVQSVLEPLINAGHRVRYIQGQHEIVVQAHYENYPWLSVCRGAEHLHGCKFDFLGMKAFALDYFPQAFEALNLACVPEDTEVLMVHGTAAEVFEMSHHFSMENVPDHVKYVLAGDYHVPTQWSTPDGSKQIFYTGSAWMREASESFDKFVLKIERDADKLFIERIPLKSRMILRYSQMTEEQRKGQLTTDTTLPEPLQRPVVIVDIPIEDEEHAKLVEHCHTYTMGSRSLSSPIELINVADDSQTDEQILNMYVDKNQYPSEFDFTMDVIQNPVSDAVQRLRNKLDIDVSDLEADVAAQT